MLKKLLLAAAVTAAVFVAHGAAAAVTGNPQTYSTVVTISGIADGTGTGPVPLTLTTQAVQQAVQQRLTPK